MRPQMLKSYLRGAFGLLLSLAISATSAAADPKPRIVILTDISPATAEPDDLESTIRLLAHADLFEIEGLIATTGWSNGGGRERPDLIQDVIAAYEKDLPNLRRISGQEGHVSDESQQNVGYWPSPQYLRSRTMVGSKKRGMSFVGKDNRSPGADLIIQLAEEKDDRPVWVLVWGGGNTLAQAIWQVKEERTPEQLSAFLHKLRVYTITDQDKALGRNVAPELSAHFWMRREFAKDLFFIWDESAWTFQNSTGRANWDKYAADIQNHKNLGTMYPKYRFGVEGDTPSFLYVWPNGLNDPENPSYAGWGGTFAHGVTSDRKTSAYNNHQGSSVRATSRKYETRFYPAIYNSFVARMAWAKDGTGNRNPQVVINGDGSLAKINLTPAPGASVTLDASATKDPDGDKLTYSWWVLKEAGDYTKEINMTGSDSSRAIVDVPADAAGKTFHVICEVADGGAPSLTSYRRVVVAPKGSTENR